MSAAPSNRALGPAREGDKSGPWATVPTHSERLSCKAKARKKPRTKASSVRTVFTGQHFNILFAFSSILTFLCKNLPRASQPSQEFTPNDCFASPPLVRVLQYFCVCGWVCACVLCECVFMASG